MTPRQQQKILNVLASFGESGATVSQAAHRACISHGGMAGYIRELRAAGLVMGMGMAPDNRSPMYAIGDEVVIEPEQSIFDQCRQNWQGYQVHKIFGSTSRATA